MKRISINPITRLEGHGKIEIFLDSDGNVANTYFQVPELRGFEQFCVGRRAEDMPVIMSRICGVCPEAHHLAATKALDALFGVEARPAAKKIRELLYMAFFITDHTTHFYALGGPDFIIGPDGPPQERNILGVVRNVGLDIGKQVIACRARNHHVIEMLGGRGVHPAAGLPGGWSKSISEQERREIEQVAAENVKFAQLSLQIFDSFVLQNKAYTDLIHCDTYQHKTYYMGTVDPDNCANFYDGKIRVIDPEGREVLRFPAAEYCHHISEHVEPWTYLKFPYLKQIGWKGFADGIDSGVYCATPLARLNVADGLSTPLSQAEFDRFFTAFGRKKVNDRYQPVHHRMATHWARLIELLHAAERMQELVRDPEITSDDVRCTPSAVAGVGVGSVEAPRGTLFHHYETDERGILTRVNLVVGTTNNHAAISLSIKRAAEKLIQAGRVIEEGLLNRIEMAFRLYDPCLSCATHALPGSMPLIVNLRDGKGEIIRTFQRDE